MTEFHIGRGTDRGPLTVFPVWGTYTGPRGYSLDTTTAIVAEQENGPVVASLTVSNPGTTPLLMVEGTLLEGGWQNRMLTRSVLVPAQQSLNLEVVCVEQGRWDGTARHRATNRRASIRVRNVDDRRGNRQGEVWQQVSAYDARYGANATSSLSEHTERGGIEVEQLIGGLRPLAGQVGVVIGIAGQPVMFEAFDNPATLRQHFDAMIRAAAFDAVEAAPERTPARRAIRFVDRAMQVELEQAAPAGLGVTQEGSSQYAAVSGMTWRSRPVHLTASNPRHQVNALVGA